MKDDLTFRDSYCDEPERKKAFMAYLVEVFGLDLSLWDKAGFWDNAYRPFSCFHNDAVVSNVCVYSMDMSVQGRRCRVAQISAVGTLPAYRRQGLSRSLLKMAMDWAGDTHDFFFLFSDKDAYRFYEASGFRRVDEYKTSISVMGKLPRPGAVKMDMNRADDIDRVFLIAERRAPVSDILGVCNAKLFIFWCLYGLRKYVHHIPDLDVVVLYKRAGGLVTVYDIVGATMPAFADIYPYICDPRDEKVEFLFMTDKLHVTDSDFARIEGNGAHVRGRFPLEHAPFMFPYTSQA